MTERCDSCGGHWKDSMLPATGERASSRSRGGKGAGKGSKGKGKSPPQDEASPPKSDLGKKVTALRRTYEDIKRQLQDADDEESQQMLAAWRTRVAKAEQAWNAERGPTAAVKEAEDYLAELEKRLETVRARETQLQQLRTTLASKVEEQRAKITALRQLDTGKAERETAAAAAQQRVQAMESLLERMLALNGDPTLREEAMKALSETRTAVTTLAGPAGQPATEGLGKRKTPE